MKKGLRKERRVCKSCKARQARFRYRGRVKWDSNHTLCFACYRSVITWVHLNLAADRNAVHEIRAEALLSQSSSDAIELVWT